jgi:RNA polymerase sigma-70 factor (ECF subfamily)
MTDPAELRRAYDAARAAWPGIEVAFEAFAARLIRGHPAHANDLYLACACGDGSPAAIAALDRIFLRGVRDAIARIDRSADFQAEVQQQLRERLLVGAGARIRAYRGGGALAGWIHTAAVRTALNLRRRIQNEHKRDTAFEPSGSFESMLDPELALLRRRYLPEVNAALRRALAALAPRDRLLLHAYYVDELTLARIAAAEQVGTSTVFRRITAATRAVLAGIKQELTAKLQISVAGLDRLLHDVRDGIDLSPP